MIYFIACLSCIICWPIAVLFIKYYQDCKYYRALGREKAEREKLHEETEVLWSITRVMEVSLESSFQPLVQLYIIFPEMLLKFNLTVRTTTAILKELTTVFSECGGSTDILQPAQTMSIMTSILGKCYF